MKAPKVSLDTKKLQALLLQHVEKLVLVVVIVLVGWFVYQGYILEGLPEGQSPDLLLQQGNDTLTFINDANRWTAVVSKEPTRQVDMQVINKVEESQKPTDPSKFRLPNSISPPDFPKLSLRVDPKIFPPLHVMVATLDGPLAAYTDGTEIDPLTSDKVEATPEVGPRPKTVKAPRPPRVPKGEGAAPPAYPKGKTKRGEGAGLLEGAPPNMPVEGNFAQPGMQVARGGVNPESIRGYEADANAIARDARAMVVMAVVPSEKQFDEFEKSLASSLDYDPNRDSPLYLQFAVERADVTANPAADPAGLAWIKLNVPAALTETEKWAGFPTEIVDPAYLHEKLTHPAPPFMQRDLWDALTHPDVPLATYDSGDVAPTDAPAVPKATPEDTPGIDLPMPTAGGEGGLGGPQRPTRPSGFPGEGGPGMRPVRTPRTPIIQEGSATTYGSGGVPVAKPKYQLIRFTDTSVERGKQYRYRVRVYLHDPNHPATGYTPPTIVSLHDTVRTRLKDVDAADAKKPGTRTYWLMSDWSEPSAPAILPPNEHFFAGKVSQPAATTIIEGRPKVAASQPLAKAVAVVWDKTKVVDVAAEHDVYRGSAMNFTMDAQVIHPVTHDVIDLAKYPFQTRALVVDMQGGEKIPPINKRNEHPLESPGELLVFDATGNLHVLDESRDVEGYRRYLVPKPETKKTTPTGDPNAGFQDLLAPPPPPVRRPTKGG